ncbi:MAG: histidine phosphatase family protein [Luminiphilus sp.]|jgi:broad specificity phosphatase PhoE|nr:histidine phosphatase family protein [Luminiphilus sp.]
MASLYLIRHGQASFGTDHYDQLSALGQRQADVSGRFFADVGLHFSQAASGDLSRQRETGERVLASQPDPAALHIDARLNEVDNEGQIAAILPILCERDPALAERVSASRTDSKQYQKIIQAVFTAWVSPDCPELPATASWSDYLAGVRGALEDAMARAESGTDTAIFTSGGTIATAVSWVLGVRHDQIYGFYEPVFNCSITRLIFSRGRISLSNFNDTAHLQLLSRQLGEELVTYR